MTRVRTAIVVGGGIAGPATAMALQKAGIESVVYEAHDTGADGIGTFLTVGSNGVDVLRVLGADRPVLAAAFPTPTITLRSGTGNASGRTGPVGPCPTARRARRSSARTCIERCARRHWPGECRWSIPSAWSAPR